MKWHNSLDSVGGLPDTAKRDSQKRQLHPHVFREKTQFRGGETLNRFNDITQSYSRGGGCITLTQGTHTLHPKKEPASHCPSLFPENAQPGLTTTTRAAWKSRVRRLTPKNSVSHDNFVMDEGKSDHQNKKVTL